MNRFIGLRHHVLTAAAVGALLLLAGCAQFGSFGDIDITPDFQPSTLGFEANVNDEGQVELVITSHVLFFKVRPGSIGGRVDGYRVEYFDSAGAPLNIGDSQLYSSGSLGITVPSGISCAASEADSAAACSINDPGARFAPRESASKSNFITLPAEIAIEVFVDSLVGGRADFYFDFTTDLNREIELGPFQVSITYPVQGG